MENHFDELNQTFLDGQNGWRRASPSRASPIVIIELRNNPASGWTKKLQIYFGSSIRINYNPNIVTLQVVTAPIEPIAGLTIINDSPTILGNPTTFTATVTAGEPVTFTWDFGDGATSAGPVVAHTYPARGTFTALVTATNAVSSLTDTTTVTIIVANQPPNAVDDTDTTLEDTSVTISVLSNDTDDGPLNVSAVSAPANGTASTDGTTVTYTPTLNFNGDDVFSYTVSDTGGLTDTATVTVTVESAPIGAIIRVDPLTTTLALSTTGVLTINVTPGTEAVNGYSGSTVKISPRSSSK